MTKYKLHVEPADFRAADASRGGIGQASPTKPPACALTVAPQLSRGQMRRRPTAGHSVTMQKFGELFWGNGMSPHALCATWDSALLAWTISGDLGTAAAYLFISAITLIEARRQWLLMPSWLLGLFAASALLCGFSHVLTAWTLFHPTYWLQAGEKVLTAAVSILAAMALLFVRAASPGGLAAKWWEQTQALRHELRNARMVINLLRERSGRLPVIWDDDVLNAPIDMASARRKRPRPEAKR